jgi:chromosome segregation ATPase
MSLQALSSATPSFALGNIREQSQSSLTRITEAALQAITTLKEQKSALKTENHSLAERVTVLTESHGKQVEETNKIAQQLSSTQQELQVKSTAHTSLSTENTALKQELSTTKTDLAAAESSKASLQRDLNSAHQEIEKLKALIDALAGDVESHAAQFGQDLSKLLSAD